MAKLFRKGLFAEAEALLRGHVAKSPEDLRLHEELFRLLWEAGDVGAALEAARTWHGAGGGEAACLALAEAHLAAGQPEEALDLLSTAEGEDPSLEFVFLRAEALVARARTSGRRETWREAERALQILTSRSPGDALGWWRLAEVSEALGAADRALAALERCVAADSNYTKAHGRIARLHRERKEYARALERFERAVRVRPRDEALRRESAQLAAEVPWEARQREEARRREWEEWKAPVETELPASSITLRVGLLEDAGEIEIRSVSPLRVLPAEGGEGETVLPPGRAWRVEHRRKREEGERWVVQEAGGAEAVSFTTPIRLVPEDPLQTVAVHAVPSGMGYFFAKEEDRAYRGELEILPRAGRGFQVVNRISLEAATAGVLPGEMPASWPLEALKTQAVAARTDLLAKRGRHGKDGFDVCDEVHCQVYRGVSAERDSTNRAVWETPGLVLTHRGRPLAAVYSAQCGGHTQSYEEAWGSRLPLRGVPDYPRGANKEYDFPLTPAELYRWVRESPRAYCGLRDLGAYRHFRWTHVTSARDLEARVPEAGAVTAVRVTERAASGFARAVEIAGVKGSRIFRGDALRGLFGVRSNLFVLFPRRGPGGALEEVVVFGGGWGHGVGLCQAGTLGRVRAGQNYRKILKAYFPESRLEQVRE